jgi:hypothetical protein
VASAGCIAFIATAATACGTTAQLSAAAKVQQAAEKLGDQKALTMTFGIDASRQQIWTALKDEKDFSQDDAKILADLGVSIAVSSKQPLKDSKRQSLALQLSLGAEKNPLELRVVDEKFYLRADLKKLMSVGGGSNSAELKQFESMVTESHKLPSSYKSVKDAIEGKWITIDPKSFAEFAQTMGAGSGALPNTITLDKKTQQQIADAVQRAIGSSAKFKDTGSRDGADHVEVTVPADKVADALLQGLKPLKKQLPKDFPLPDPQKNAPHQDIVLDLAIKNAILSGITVVLATLDKKAKGKIPLAIGFAAGSQPVKAPANATTLNPQDIMGAMMELMTGDGLGVPPASLKGLDLSGTRVTD